MNIQDKMSVLTRLVFQCRKEQKNDEHTYVMAGGDKLSE